MSNIDFRLAFSGVGAGAGTPTKLVDDLQSRQQQFAVLMEEMPGRNL